MDGKSYHMSETQAVLPYLENYPKFGYFWHKFDTRISVWLLGLFGYFFGYFWKYGKKLVLNQFKAGLCSISLCFDVDIFSFWKSFNVDILDFQKCFDVGLLGFSKICLLFAQTFWQHWTQASNPDQMALRSKA